MAPRFARSQFVPPRSSRPAILLAAVAGAALSLAGCRDEELPRPNTNAFALPATEALPFAPPAWELAAAPPRPVARPANPNDGYAWAEQAYGMDYAFHDAPPDYGFEYDGVEPWGWETPDDWTMLLEPLADGNRSYYYAPGYDHPFLVRDPEYAYAYDGDGRLTALYAADGRLLPVGYLYRQADVAGRYYARGEQMWDVRAQPQRYVEAPPALWLARRETIVQPQTVWIQAAEQVPAWRDYRVRTQETVIDRFREERRRRAPQVARAERIEREWREAARREGRQGGSLQVAALQPPPVRVRSPERELERPWWESRRKEDRDAGERRARFGQQARGEDDNRRQRDQAALQQARAELRQQEDAPRQARPERVREEGPGQERRRADRARADGDQRRGGERRQERARAEEGQRHARAAEAQRAEQVRPEQARHEQARQEEAGRRDRRVRAEAQRRSQADEQRRGAERQAGQEQGRRQEEGRRQEAQRQEGQRHEAQRQESQRQARQGEEHRRGAERQAREAQAQQQEAHRQQRAQQQQAEKQQREARVQQADKPQHDHGQGGGDRRGGGRDRDKDKRG